jgi:hypothetical protein
VFIASSLSELAEELATRAYQYNTLPL